MTQNINARFLKVMSEGVQLSSTTFFYVLLVDEDEGGFKYHDKRAIIGPPAKRHSNGVLLAC